MITNAVDGAKARKHVQTEPDGKMGSESRDIVKECLSEGDSCRFRISVDWVEWDVDIPMTAMRVLEEALRQRAQGKAPVVMPLDAEVSTQQAADVLNFHALPDPSFGQR
ncbi:MAG: hypothetical protein J2P21_24465 [Chloracidobacterium sp.]|nr:hypothetical protein [Chloracidobacterium sp.]